jgi:hypothetical protein
MWTTVGIRGSNTVDCCNHEHESRDEAQKCLIEHQAEMRRLNKKSVRQIAEADSLDQIADEATLY